MASKVLGDNFLGTGNIDGTAPPILESIASAAWSTTFNPGFAVRGAFYRSGSGGVHDTRESNGQTCSAVVTPSGLTLGTGTNVFECSAKAAFAFILNFGTNWAGIQVWDTSIFYGSDHPSLGFVSGSGSVSSRTLTTTTVMRVEIEAAAMRFYVDGTLVGSFGAGLAAGTTVTSENIEYTTSATYPPAANITAQLLNYVHTKTETTTGALGVPTAGSGGEAPVPATLLDDYFNVSPTIHGTRPQFSTWTGAWSCTQTSFAAGTTTLLARRTSGGAVLTPTSDALACTMEFHATNPSRIGGGKAVAQVLVYGSPSVTLNIGAGGLVFSATSLTSADVGVVGSATPLPVTTGPSGRTDLVFVLSETDAKIYVNSSLVRTIAGGSPETQINGITILWPGPQNSEPTRMPIGESRMLDLVRIRHGMTTDILVYPGPRAAPTPQKYVRARPTKTIGEFTQQGQRKLIVPTDTKIALDAVNYVDQTEVSLDITATAGADSSAYRTALPHEITTPSSMDDDAIKLQTVIAHTSTTTPYVTGPYGGNEVGHYESVLVWPATQFHGDWYQTTWVVDYVMPVYYGVQYWLSDSLATSYVDSAVAARTDIQIADLTIPADDADFSIEIRTSTAGGVTGGAAPGFTVPDLGFYSSIVVADVLTPADIQRFNITVHPSYISPVDPSLLPDEQRRVAKLIAETVGEYHNFWTRFNATYESSDETP